MKLISRSKKQKPFTSSFNICPEACCKKREAGGVTPYPATSTLFPSSSVEISFVDDVTVILLLDFILHGVSYCVQFTDQQLNCYHIFSFDTKYWVCYGTL
jgi:hypothetical protein